MWACKKAQPYQRLAMSPSQAMCYYEQQNYKVKVLLVLLKNLHAG